MPTGTPTKSNDDLIGAHSSAKTKANLGWVIFRKEIREIFTDRRTLFAAVISPLFITPLIILLSGTLVQSQTKKEAQAIYKIGLVNAGASPELVRYLASTPNVEFMPETRQAAESEVAAHTLKAAIVIPNNASHILSGMGTVDVVILRDPGNDVSTSAAERLQGQLHAFSEIVKAERLKRAHLPQDFGTPLNIDIQATKGSGSTAMYLLAMFIPYVLAVSAFSGGMAAANDQIAGEKERGTLETLLVSPATRREIVVGKFSAIACVCVVSGILSVVGLIVPLSLHGAGLLPGVSSLGGIKMGWLGAFEIAVAQIPLALLFSGLLVAVSSYARNQKEVQVYQAPLLMLILVPAMGTMFISTDQPISTALIPVLNTSLLIKQILAGVNDPAFLAVAVVSSAVYAAIGIVIATSIFENEQVLLKS
jgi:sodium transport system permease protein